MPKTFLPKALATALPALGTAAALSLAATAAPAQSLCGDVVTVEAGDTLSGISERCEVPLETILAANPDVDPLALQVGQQISLVAGAVPVETEADGVMPEIEPQPVPEQPPALEPEPAPEAEPAPMPAPEPEPLPDY